MLAAGAYTGEGFEDPRPVSAGMYQKRLKTYKDMGHVITDNFKEPEYEKRGYL